MFEWFIKGQELDAKMIAKLSTHSSKDIEIVLNKLPLSAIDNFYLHLTEQLYKQKSAKSDDKFTKIRYQALYSWAKNKLLIRQLKKDEKNEKDKYNQAFTQIAGFSLILPDILKEHLNWQVGNVGSDDFDEKKSSSADNISSLRTVREKSHSDAYRYSKYIEESRKSILDHNFGGYESRVPNATIHSNKIIEISSPITYVSLGLEKYEEQKEHDLIEVWLEQPSKLNTTVTYVPQTADQYLSDDNDIRIVEIAPVDSVGTAWQTTGSDTTGSLYNWIKELIQTNTTDTESLLSELPTPKNDIKDNLADANQEATGTEEQELQLEDKSNMNDNTVPANNIEQETELNAFIDKVVEPNNDEQVNIDSHSGQINTDSGQVKQGLNFTETKVNESINPISIEVGSNEGKVQETKTAAYYNNLARVLKTQKDTEPAISAYIKSIEIDPDNIEAHNNLGTLYQREKKLNLAKEQYEMAIESSLKLLKKYTDKGEDRKAAELSYNIAIAYNNLGTLYQKQNKIAFAEVEYQKAIKIVPSFAAAHCNLGNLWVKQKKYADAEVELIKAINSEPLDSLARYSLATLYHKQGKQKYYEAEGAYKEAIKLNDKIAVYHANLALLYYQQVKLGMAKKQVLDLAKAEYEEAKRLSIHDKSVYDKINENLMTLKMVKGKISFIEKEERVVVDIKPYSLESEEDEASTVREIEELDLNSSEVLDQQGVDRTINADV